MKNTTKTYDEVKNELLNTGTISDIYFKVPENDNYNQFMNLIVELMVISLGKKLKISNRRIRISNDKIFSILKIKEVSDNLNNLHFKILFDITDCTVDI